MLGKSSIPAECFVKVVLLSSAYKPYHCIISVDEEEVFYKCKGMMAPKDFVYCKCSGRDIELSTDLDVISYPNLPSSYKHFCSCNNIIYFYAS